MCRTRHVCHVNPWLPTTGTAPPFKAQQTFIRVEGGMPCLTHTNTALLENIGVVRVAGVARRLVSQTYPGNETNRLNCWRTTDWGYREMRES